MPIHRRRSTKPEEPDQPVDQPDPDEPVIINDTAQPETARANATVAGIIHSDDTSSTYTHAPEEWPVDVGVDVVGACGHKIGEVVDIRDDCVVVEKGFFMPEDIFVPKSAICDADAHHLVLNVTKDSVDHSNWDEDPDEDAYPLPERRVS